MGTESGSRVEDSDIEKPPTPPTVSRCWFFGPKLASTRLTRGSTCVARCVMICDVRKQSAGIEIKPRLPANGTGSKAQERGTQPGRSPCGINSSPTRTNSEEDASRGVPSGMLAVGTGATGEKSGPYAGVQHPEDPAGSRGREELPERQGQPECQNRRPSRPTPSMGRSVGQV